MTAKLTNDICRCTGDTEIDGEVKICPVRNECLRYLEREAFRMRRINSELANDKTYRKLLLKLLLNTYSAHRGAFFIYEAK